MNVNVTIEIRSLVFEAPKHFKLAIASRRAAFSGNASLIATFSSILMFIVTIFVTARNTYPDKELPAE